MVGSLQASVFTMCDMQQLIITAVGILGNDCYRSHELNLQVCVGGLQCITLTATLPGMDFSQGGQIQLAEAQAAGVEVDQYGCAGDQLYIQGKCWYGHGKMRLACWVETIEAGEYAANSRASLCGI